MSEASGLDPVDDAWEASSLNRFTIPAFVDRLNNFEAFPNPIGSFASAHPQTALPVVRDSFQRSLAKRRSTKQFGPDLLSAKSVARILAAVGPTGDGGRAVPSAGGLQALHVFGIGCATEGVTEDSIFRYDHRRHEVAVLGKAPDRDTIRRLGSLDCDGEPQLLLFWVLDPVQVRARYGPRALRLLLQEVGHGAQNVALRLSHDGLVGYPLGGVLDTEVIELLGLRGLDAWVAGGFACGRT